MGSNRDEILLKYDEYFEKVQLVIDQLNRWFLYPLSAISLVVSIIFYLALLVMKNKHSSRIIVYLISFTAFNMILLVHLLLDRYLLIERISITSCKYTYFMFELCMTSIPWLLTLIIINQYKSIPYEMFSNQRFVNFRNKPSIGNINTVTRSVVVENQQVRNNTNRCEPKNRFFQVMQVICVIGVAFILNAVNLVYVGLNENIYLNQSKIMIQTECTYSNQDRFIHAIEIALQIFADYFLPLIITVVYLVRLKRNKFQISPSHVKARNFLFAFIVLFLVVYFMVTFFNIIFNIYFFYLVITSSYKTGIIRIESEENTHSIHLIQIFYVLQIFLLAIYLAFFNLILNFIFIFNFKIKIWKFS